MPTAEISGVQITEPDITINGVALSLGQAMAVRVATMQYLAELTDDPYSLGEDDNGRAMAQGYRDRLTEVLRLMSKSVDLGDAVSRRT